MLGDEEGKAIANQSRLSPATEGNKGLYDLLKLKGDWPRGAARATKFSTSESAPSPGAGVTHALREPAASAARVEIQLAATRLELTASRQQRRDGDARQ